MPRKPTKRKRAPRQSPFARSLEYATKRLARAQSERDKCVSKLRELSAEIPRLEEILRALTPAEIPDGMVRLPQSKQAASREEMKSVPAPFVAAGLEKYFKPRPSVGVPDPVSTDIDEDALLTDNLPKGTPIIE